MPIDYSKYPPDWRTRIVPAITERSQGRCEGDEVTGYELSGRCNAINGTEIVRVPNEPASWMPHHPEFGDGLLEPVRVVLTVAHLDHDETNHDVSLDRLRHLCQRCHLRYDAEEKARRRREKAGVGA